MCGQNNLLGMTNLLLIQLITSAALLNLSQGKSLMGKMCVLYAASLVSTHYVRNSLSTGAQSTMSLGIAEYLQDLWG